MKIKAYILVNVSAGKWQEVVNMIRDLPGILACESITGPHDAIISVAEENLETLKQLVIKIQQVNGVERTVTCVVL